MSPQAEINARPAFPNVGIMDTINLAPAPGGIDMVPAPGGINLVPAPGCSLPACSDTSTLSGNFNYLHGPVQLKCRPCAAEVHALCS